jgi:hypothetical protein
VKQLKRLSLPVQLHQLRHCPRLIQLRQLRLLDHLLARLRQMGPSNQWPQQVQLRLQVQSRQLLHMDQIGQMAQFGLPVQLRQMALLSQLGLLGQ